MPDFDFSNLNKDLKDILKFKLTTEKNNIVFGGKLVVPVKVEIFPGEKEILLKELEKKQKNLMLKSNTLTGDEKKDLKIV